MGEKGSIECPESATTLILYLYGEAPDPEGFEKHVEACPDCSRWLDAHRQTLKSYRATAPAPGVPPIRKVWRIPAEYKSPGGIAGILRPVAATAVAAALVLALALLLGRLEPPAAYIVTENIETRLDEIETILDDLSAFESVEEVETVEQEGMMSELDDMMAELNDIQSGLTQF